MACECVLSALPWKDICHSIPLQAVWKAYLLMNDSIEILNDLSPSPMRLILHRYFKNQANDTYVLENNPRIWLRETNTGISHPKYIGPNDCHHQFRQLHTVAIPVLRWRLNISEYICTVHHEHSVGSASIVVVALIKSRNIKSYAGVCWALASWSTPVA